MRIDGWMADSAWRKSLACGSDARWPTITPSAGMDITGACHAKKSARDCGVRRWKSNGVWMAPIGYAFAAAISACAIAQHPYNLPQVLPAYGLQDSRNDRDLKPKSNPNTMCLPSTPGGNRGTGHFYIAKKRTFLLCVDSTRRHHFSSMGSMGFPGPVAGIWPAGDKQTTKCMISPDGERISVSLG